MTTTEERLSADMPHEDQNVPQTPVEQRVEEVSTWRNYMREGLVGGASLIAIGALAVAYVRGGTQEIDGHPVVARVPAVSSHPNVLGHTTHTPAHEPSPTDVRLPAINAAAPNVINLTAVSKKTDTTLAVSDAKVPEYINDPLTDPTARFNAFLADYSYFLSTPKEADAEVALQAITSDQTMSAKLEAARQSWQELHPGKMLWFWSSASEPGTITTYNDGKTSRVVAEEPIYYKAVDMPGGVWGKPADFTSEGEKSMLGMTLTFGDNANQGDLRTSLIDSSVTGQPNVIFPN